MKKIIGIIIAGIIIMTLFGNGKSRGTRVNKEAENRTGTETTVTGGQNAGSEQESEENLTENQEEETEPEEEQEPEDEPEDEQNESAEDGISPEFKAAMDSYEEFFDEYVAFMEKYSKSSVIHKIRSAAPLHRGCIEWDTGDVSLSIIRRHVE